MANEISMFRDGNGQSYHINSEVADNEYPVMGSGIKAYVDGAASAATTEKLGLVKMSANVAEAAGDAPTAAEFKALLDALIAAGIMAEPATP